jgi:hypothetical protein
VAHDAGFGAQALAAPGILANDSDADGNALGAVKVSECVLNSSSACIATSNRITLAANGSLSLASSSATNALRMTYRTSDGTGTANQFSLDSTVTINMVANRAPVAAGDTFTVPRCTFRLGTGSGCRTGSGFYQPLTLNLASNDSDLDAATLDRGNQLPLSVARVRAAAAGASAGSVTSAPTASGGTVSIAGGAVTYIPPYNFAGTDTFRYRIKDKQGKESGSTTSNANNLGSGWATVTLNVQ